MCGQFHAKTKMIELNGFKYEITRVNNVIYVQQNMLLGHLKANSKGQKIHTIKVKKFALNGILLHKNSPIRPLFMHGVTYLKESGLERQLFYKWFGELGKLNDSTPFEGHIITLGQLVTLFLMIALVFTIALVLLCGEILLKKVIHKISYQRRNPTR